MPSWPGTLPQFVLRDGYGEGFQNNMIRTNMDTGPAKRRRRTTASAKPFRVRIVVTTDEWDIFESFFENDIESGALSFDYTNPRTNLPVTVAFVSTPDPPVPEGAYTYILTMDLEILP